MNEKKIEFAELGELRVVHIGEWHIASRYAGRGGFVCWAKNSRIVAEWPILEPGHNGVWVDYAPTRGQAIAKVWNSLPRRTWRVRLAERWRGVRNWFAPSRRLQLARMRWKRGGA